MRRPSGRHDWRMRARLLPALLFLILAACAPRLAPPGPGLETLGLAAPAIADDRFITADGTSLPLRRWTPAEGKAPHGMILALHGFNDYSHAFANSGAALAAEGLIVYAYDQRGFGAAPNRGLWPGIDTLTGDLADAARLLRRRHPDLPLYLLGESMGGAVILAALADSDTSVNALEADGVILAAPAVWARSTMPFHQRAALWLGARLIPWARFSGRGLGIQASDNIEMLRALGRDPLFIKETRTDAVYGLVNLMDAALAAAPTVEAETLLLYGARDQVVPAKPTFRFWRNLPAADEGRTDRRQRFALYPEGWHMLLRDLQAQVVIQDIAAWTRDPKGPLPSGAEAYAAAALHGTDPEEATAAAR
ncbi:lysophospholipase [Pelagibius sp. 7325]|uniref:alpha/beta hydrolase n=1 Tax=Pelagibius sp. 7325 TaxID=3131994 RepID=UPI0030EC9DD7